MVPPPVPTFSGVLSLFKGGTGEHHLVEHYLVLVGGNDSVLGKRACRYWIQYPGIGSNTVQDRRSKIEDAGKSFWSIYNLQSSIQAGIGSNTRVLDPIPSRIED